MTPFRKKAIIAFLLMGLGAVSVIVFYAITNYSMNISSKPTFCVYCHEMAPAYDSWKTSSHYSNKAGVVVDCGDCHLPNHKDTFRYMAAKAYVGARDVFLHFLGGEYDQEEMRQKVYAEIKDERCLKCHANLLGIPDNSGARVAHQASLYPEAGQEIKRCTDCHRNLVHVKKSLYFQDLYKK